MPYFSDVQQRRRDSARGVKKSARASAILARRKRAGVGTSKVGGGTSTAKVPFAPFPKAIRATLRYCTYVILDPSVASPNRSYAFRANSGYDPDLTGTGHQPYGWDQYAALYDQYVVEKSRITVTCMSSSQANAGYSHNNLVWGILAADDGAISLDLEQLMEQDNTVFTMTDANNTMLTNYFDGKKWFQGKQVDALQTNVVNNPSEEVIYHLWVGSTHPAVDEPAAARFMVTISYDVMFTERKRFAKS